MSQTIQSRPYHPQAACERCVFGSGEHAPWCEHAPRATYILDAYQWQSINDGPAQQRYFTPDRNDSSRTRCRWCGSPLDEDGRCAMAAQGSVR